MFSLYSIFGAICLDCMNDNCKQFLFKRGMSVNNSSFLAWCANHTVSTVCTDDWRLSWIWEEFHVCKQKTNVSYMGFLSYGFFFLWMELLIYGINLQYIQRSLNFSVRFILRRCSIGINKMIVWTAVNWCSVRHVLTSSLFQTEDVPLLTVFPLCLSWSLQLLQL